MSPLALIGVALLAGIAIMALSQRGPRHPFPVGSPEADAATLAALCQAGSDLTKETDVQFYLYFPTREQATRAAEGIRNATFVPDVEPAAVGSRWLCRVVARIVPSETTVRGASIRFQAVAATMGGTYDGWEAAVRPGYPSIAPMTSSGTPYPSAAPPVNALIKWLVAGIMYVNGPRRIHRTQRIGATQQLSRMSPEEVQAIPIELQQYLETTEHALLPRGFDAPLRVTSNLTTNSRAYVSLLEHSDRTTLCSVFVTRSARGDTAAVVMFRSELPDGVALITSNSRQKRRFPRRPGQDPMSFPAAIDPADIYDIHRFRVREHLKDARPHEITRGQDPLAYQQRETTETHDHWLRTGYFRRATDGSLRPTWRGAVCMVWRAKFPWAQLTDWRDRRARDVVLVRYAAPNSRP